MIDQPGSVAAGASTPAPPPAPVAFLAKDMAVSHGGGCRLCVMRRATCSGSPSGLRLVPRVDPDA